MQKNRITVRLDEDLSLLLSRIQKKQIFNISAIVRDALREKLLIFFDIDNSSQVNALEKDLEK